MGSCNPVLWEAEAELGGVLAASLAYFSASSSQGIRRRMTEQEPQCSPLASECTWTCELLHTHVHAPHTHRTVCSQWSSAGLCTRVLICAVLGDSTRAGSELGPQWVRDAPHQPRPVIYRWIQLHKFQIFLSPSLPGLINIHEFPALEYLGS